MQLMSDFSATSSKSVLGSLNIFLTFELSNVQKFESSTFEFRIKKNSKQEVGRRRNKKTTDMIGKVQNFAEYFLGHDKLVIRQFLVQYGNILLVPGFFRIFSSPKGSENIVRKNPGTRKIFLILYSQPSDNYYIFKIGGHNLPLYSIDILNTNISVLIDSGSAVNIIDEATYNSLNPKPSLSKSSSRIFPYQSTHPIPTLGRFSTIIRADGQEQLAEFIVVKGESGSILGRSTAVSLDILRIGRPSEPELVRSLSSREYKENIMKNHSQLFEGVGKLKNFQLKLHIDQNVTPVQQPIRRIPFHSREKIETELDRLIKFFIIRHN